MIRKYAIVKFIDEDSIKLSDLIELYYDAVKAAIKINSFKNMKRSLARLVNFFGDVPCDSIEKAAARRYVSRLRILFAPNFVRNNYSYAKSVFDFGVNEEKITSNPFRGLDIPKASSCGRALENEEIKLLLPHIPNSIYRDAAKFILCTGLRRNEVCNLEPQQIRLPILNIPKSKSKNGIARDIVLSEDAVKLLPPGWQRRNSVFAISRSGFNRAMIHAYRLAGIGKVRIHDLRHTWATRYWDQTKDVKALKIQGGWTSNAFLNYQHVSQSRALGGMRSVSISYGFGNPSNP